MAYCSTYTKEERFELVKVLKDTLKLQINDNNLDIVYDIVSKYFGKLIYKDFKKNNIDLEKLFKKNYVINIVLEYGLLYERIPGSLIHFVTFKKQKLSENKDKLVKKIMNKTSILTNVRSSSNSFN